VSNGIPGFFTGTGMPDPGWWEALWPDPAGVLTALDMVKGQSVIDLCSGDGWFTLQIAKIARHVTAIDIDDALLETARTRLSEAGRSNCSFVAADAYDIAKYVTAQVDHVFLANAFHGVPDKPRLSGSVKSVLKRGGIFSIVSWHARPREQTVVLGQPRGPATELRMTPEQTIAVVEPGGFKIRKVVEVSPYHYGVVFETTAA
jgi:protein-L-isoaspartate O-methyltransferase